MMKVVIVDDDSLVRIGLKSIINWQENGFELVGEASDGNKALAVIQACNPDIVITDIKMPVMDGLELMRKLAELKKSPKVIVLSSYNDFHLVKEAMKLGAEDYLLKLDIEPEYLIGILKKTAQKVEDEQKKEEQELNLDSQLIMNLNAMRRNFLRDVVNHFYVSERDLKESMDFLDIRLNTEFIYCFMIKISEIYRFEEVMDEQLHILNFSIMNISEEIINDVLCGYCFEGKTGEFFLLASRKEGQDNTIHQHQLVELGTRLSEMLEQYLNVTATIGIGEGKGGIKGIDDAYKRALTAVRYRFFEENEGVILWNNIKTTDFYMDSYSILSMKSKLHKSLSFHEKEELEAVFQQIQMDIEKLRLSKASVCNIILELFYMVREFSEVYQMEIGELMGESLQTYHQLTHIESITEAKRWISHVKEGLIKYMSNEDETFYSRLISKARKYIENHFNEDISLKEVADEVNLNPSYFSTLLKRTTGYSYSDYITQVRVNNAKYLLETTDYKVYEVGEKVGYQSIYYFNRIFKKVTGISPGEYKKKI